jgi:flagella basal body P-ring formation protein FlgA
MSSVCSLRLSFLILLGLVWLSPVHAQNQAQIQPQAQPQNQVNTTPNQALQAPGIPLEVQNNIRRFIQKSPTVLGFRTEVDFLDPSMNLPSCQGGSIEVLSAPNVRLWGRSLVQVRCLKAAWLFNIPLMIRVYGDYVVSTRYLQPGNRLSSSDMRIINGDLTSVPDDVIRTPKEADDRVLTRPIQMGMPIGLNDLRETAVIKVGDPVTILLKGRDFQVTGSGTAQTQGMINDMVRVRLNDGQVLQGKVIRPGVVEMTLDR